jgi:hypothetical protein
VLKEKKMHEVIYCTAYSVAALARRLARDTTQKMAQEYQAGQEDNKLYLVNMATAQTHKIDVRVDTRPPVTYFGRVILPY